MAPEKPLVSDVEHAVAMVQNGTVNTRLLVSSNELSINEEFEVEAEAAEIETISDSKLNKKEEKLDDDLTSLSWLQDKNLLKGINLRTSNTRTASTTVIGVSDAQESPTSDFVDDFASDSTCSSVNSSSPTPMSSVGTAKKHPHHIPYDPKIHVSSKPPYSFSCLIFMAIDDSSMKALPVKEIYNWILEHFPFYRNAPTGWKNSVRHNLSLNKCFTKVEKAPNLGKGSLWMVDPNYRPNLVQAITKTPNNPYKTWNVKQNRPLYDYGSSNSSVKIEDSDCIDDVDAATAMITLKHNILLKSSGERPPIVTSCPSADHNYIVDQIMEQRSEPTSSDEAFADGTDSDNSSTISGRKSSLKKRLEDAEERRKIAEGADALLNLAGAGFHYVEESVSREKVELASNKRKLRRSMSDEDDFNRGRNKVSVKASLSRNNKMKSSSSPNNKWKNFTDKEANYIKNKWKPQSQVINSNVNNNNSTVNNNNTIFLIESNSGTASVNRSVKVKRKLSSGIISNDSNKNR